MRHPKKYDTDEATSRRMSRVHLKNGKAERLLAKSLWHKGYRYRLNYKNLPGSPDIAIMKYQVAIFIDGEFWHGKDWVDKKQKLKRNREYWIEKIEENISRDQRVDAELRGKGWDVVHFWSMDIEKNPIECADAIAEMIQEADLTNIKEVAREPYAKPMHKQGMEQLTVMQRYC